MIIPEAVRNLEARSFSGCGVVVMKIPNDTTVDERAFAECRQLEEFEALGLKLIPTAMFERCDTLKVVVVPSLVSIGADAFAWCKSLEGFQFPPSVRSFGKHAFMNCTLLTIVSMENTAVAVIPFGAFFGCVSLQSISFPEGLAEIAARAPSKDAAASTSQFCQPSLKRLGGKPSMDAPR